MKLKDRLRSIRFRMTNTYPYRDYFVRNECIFIHVPKCAGTSILKLLADGGPTYRDHAGWFEYYRHDPYRFENYFKFSVTRNPFDRMVSVYTYLKNGGNGREDLFYREMFAEERMTFEKFVLSYVDQYNIHENILFRPQYLFLYDREHNLKVDRLVKFENLEEEFGVIASSIGLAGAKLEKLNVSDKKETSRELFDNREVVEKIVSLYRYDFELLGYGTDAD